MPREVKAKDEPPEPPKHKDEKFQVRLDPDMAREAKERAAPHGGLSAVIRALIRLWLDEGIDPNAIGQETRQAPKRKKKQK